MISRLAGLVLFALLLTGCASSPLETGEDSVTPFGPAHVLSGEASIGERVIWGGRIAAVRNLTDYTEVTVVSYPLDRADRPRLGAEPGVRFLLHQPGFLEPVQYRPGRYLSVLGRIQGLDRTPVGDYSLELPVLEAEQIHLWPADINQWQSRTRFSVGVGIRL